MQDILASTLEKLSKFTVFRFEAFNAQEKKTHVLLGSNASIFLPMCCNKLITLAWQGLLQGHPT